MVLLQAAPSWDLVITLVFVIGITYGFIMLRDRILVTLLALYAGNVIANILSEPIHKFFNGDVAILNKLWVESSMSLFTIKMIIFLAVILVFSAKSGLAGRRSHFNFVELGGYSFLSVCIALSSIFSFMEPDKLQGYVGASKLAAFVVSHQTLWFIAPVLILAVMGASSRGGGGRYADDY